MKTLTKILNDKVVKMTGLDYLVIGVIILIYTIVSFVNLGSTINPQTFYTFSPDESITICLSKPEPLRKLRLYNGENAGKYALYHSEDDLTYTYINTITGSGAFAWDDIEINKNIKYLRIIPTDDIASLGEISLYDNAEKHLDIEKIISSYNKEVIELTDEYSRVPAEISYLNSTYFDEIYFARTAYDYKEHLEAYEWTHPPLGKLLQSIPLVLSNTMAPFYYRLMGNIAGIIMIYVMYLFGIQLFKKRKWAIFSALLMFFDTFHFAQTRMGTIDSFLVLFIMLALYFMYKYVTKEDGRLVLFLSGLFFGFAVCTKWTGFLAGLALAIIYFIDFFKKKKKISKTLGEGTLFFVVIPLIFYTSVYLLFPNNQVTKTTSLGRIVTQTSEMYKYHSELERPHFFSSKWYTWPISYKPVWYYTQKASSESHGTICGVGNIIIWWLSLIAVPYLIYRIIKKKDYNSLYLIIAIMSLWLPYIFIGRVMFLYHYFPVLPFIMLAIAMFIKDIEEKTKCPQISYIYLALVIAFFIIYYPVVSGLPVSNNYLESLKLLPSWYF